ncbi:hypothetical protein HO173_002077 [Letharia columbiana]|uniref:Uncharacterized protein n=1 Tax=Letharia columbiana TaxID=112416 RepID=A0A8H6G2T6_9LECA|nr:uncharacterized protein HO173_002077 [Letharia columbiana]KAF6239533.1 hypothetical protein HO173_002077 [Letharia columbiana]
MAPKPYRVHVQQHAGSTAQEIQDKPEWSNAHQHRIGYCNRHDRRPGLTHTGDEEEEDFEEQAEDDRQELRRNVQNGDLVYFKDIVKREEGNLFASDKAILTTQKVINEVRVGFHLGRPRDHPTGWSYVMVVPQLLWEIHALDIEGGKLKLSMDDLENNFEHISIPVVLACDGN